MFISRTVGQAVVGSRFASSSSTAQASAGAELHVARRLAAAAQQQSAACHVNSAGATYATLASNVAPGRNHNAAERGYREDVTGPMEEAALQ